MRSFWPTLACALLFVACATNVTIDTDSGIDATADGPSKDATSSDAMKDVSADSSDAGSSDATDDAIDASDDAADSGDDGGTVDAGSDSGSICPPCIVKNTACCAIPKAIDYGKCYNKYCLACCM